jgi:PIN domain nuclease of toxin-antitoxin system
MRVLLDTQAFICALSTDGKQFTPKARRCFLDRKNELYLSVASVWEMAVKVSLGKLKVAVPLHQLIPDQLRQNGIRLLPIELSHALHVATLPFHHHDPFDRLLIAQALTERLFVITGDEAFDAYGIKRVW